ncbi:hypothetical protein, partial [Mycobacterium tuberculosis]
GVPELRAAGERMRDAVAYLAAV